MLTVLTNDEGIDAPGLAALRAAMHDMPGFTPVIVAPVAHWSGCGHTLTTGRDIPIVVPHPACAVCQDGPFTELDGILDSI